MRLISIYFTVYCGFVGVSLANFERISFNIGLIRSVCLPFSSCLMASFACGTFIPSARKRTYLAFLLIPFLLNTSLTSWLKVSRGGNGLLTWCPLLFFCHGWGWCVPSSRGGFLNLAVGLFRMSLFKSVAMDLKNISPSDVGIH